MCLAERGVGRKERGGEGRGEERKGRVKNDNTKKHMPN